MDDREKGRNGDREVAGRGQNREKCMKYDREFESFREERQGDGQNLCTGPLV